MINILIAIFFGFLLGFLCAGLLASAHISPPPPAPPIRPAFLIEAMRCGHCGRRWTAMHCHAESLRCPNCHRFTAPSSAFDKAPFV